MLDLKVVPKLDILVNGNPIVQVEDFYYLGITLDLHITWTPHIKKILIKISRVISILRKLKRTFSTIHTLYHLQLTYSSSSNIWFKSL